MADQQHFFSFMQSSPATSDVARPAPALERAAAAPAVPQSATTADSGAADSGASIDRPTVLEAPTALGTPTVLETQTMLETLRARVGCIAVARQDSGTVFSTGCAAMDAWLPQGGLHPASLTEWVAAHDSVAAGSLAILAAAHRLRQISDRPLVVVDPEGSLYPPALEALGVPVERLILLRPRSSADAIWAIDQSLRSGAVAAVWAMLAMRLEDRDARRLQLAAETGRTPGLLVRDFHARGKPSFADVQFYVQDKKRHHLRHRQRDRTLTLSSDFETVSVTLDRVRGGVVGKSLDVQIDDSATVRPVPLTDTRRHEAAAEHLASQLAHPKAAKRAGVRRNTLAAS